MWRFGLKQIGRFALGLLGAVLLAVLVSALAATDHAGRPLPYARAVAARVVALGRFDFGSSMVSALPAWAELSRCLPATLELVGLGALIALVVGAPLGFLLRGGRVLQVGAPLIQIACAPPIFCTSLGFLWLSHWMLNWSGAPRVQSLAAALASGNVAVVESGLRAIALPALTVGLAGAVAVQLSLRRVIARAAHEPYRRGLNAMGLGRFEIDRLYLLPQIVAGLLQSLGEIASALLAAAAVAEWVFDWPGAADLFLKSVALEDWTVVGLVLLVFAALTLAAEFAGAILARLLAETEAAP